MQHFHLNLEIRSNITRDCQVCQEAQKMFKVEMKVCSKLIKYNLNPLNLVLTVAKSPNKQHLFIYQSIKYSIVMLKMSKRIKRNVGKM